MATHQATLPLWSPSTTPAEEIPHVPVVILWPWSEAYGRVSRRVWVVFDPGEGVWPGCQAMYWTAYQRPGQVDDLLSDINPGHYRWIDVIAAVAYWIPIQPDESLVDAARRALAESAAIDATPTTEVPA